MRIRLKKNNVSSFVYMQKKYFIETIKTMYSVAPFWSFSIIVLLLFRAQGVDGGCMCPENSKTKIWSNGTPDNSDEETPVNLMIAFFGDQGLDEDATDVLNLVASEGAEAVIHLGDFDYVSSPSRWDELITDQLGETFPYFSVLGNHDAVSFSMANGYQTKIWQRLNRTSLASQCRGDIGYSYVCSFKGITFALTNPGLFQSSAEAAAFTKSAFDSFGGIWRIAGWHYVQTLYQVESQPNLAGYEIYEQSLASGAVIMTAHMHNYARSKAMSRVGNNPEVAASSFSLDTDQSIIKPGQTVITVTGTGGYSIRSCTSKYKNAQWWKTTGCDEGLRPGATFCQFNFNGDARTAFCYFKQTDGRIVDQYFLKTENVAVPVILPTTDCFCDVSGANIQHFQISLIVIFLLFFYFK